MIRPTYEGIPFVAFPVAVFYVLSIYVLAFRLGWLRRNGRAPEAPTATEFLFGRFGWGSVAYVFSGRYKLVGDRVVTTLVMAARTLLVLYVPLLAALFVLFPLNIF